MNAILKTLTEAVVTIAATPTPVIGSPPFSMARQPEFNDEIAALDTKFETKFSGLEADFKELKGGMSEILSLLRNKKD